MIVITINYLLGLFISKRKSKLWFVLGVILNVFSLAFYKYAGLVIQIKDAFLTNNLIDGLMLINGDVETNIIAPVAISFITFKNISYLYDIYKDKYSVDFEKKYDYR